MESFELRDHKCPNCGASVKFDSGTQMMKCPYCGSEFATDYFAENLPQDNMSWDDSSETNEFTDADGMNVYVCDSCGGEIITDDTTSATACPYCDNPVVMKGRVSGILKPDYIIPFKLDKSAAMAGFKKHLSDKKLLPKVFKTENHIEEIKGVYVPFWLFDAQADAEVRYHGTKKRTWTTSDYIYTETSHFDIYRAGNLAFSRVPVDGSSKMADDLMESVEPYDHSEAVPFNTAFLSGYFADKYDVSKQDSIPRANLRIKQSTEDTFRDTVMGYSTLSTMGSSVRFSDSSASYALYPVWILNTVWKGERYTFAMNGQTGKFVGNLPCDKSAYRKWLFGIFGAGFAVLGAIASLLWLL